MRPLAALVVLAVLLPATVMAAAPPPVRTVTFPRTAVVGSAWHVTLRAPTAPSVVATGPVTLRAKAVRKAKGVFGATIRFSRAGTWRIAALLAGRTTRLGSVSVDVRRDPLIVNPLTIAVESSGALLVGQGDTGPLLRVTGGRATTVASGTGVYHVVAAASGAVYVAGADGAVHRLEDSRLVPVTPALDAGAAAVDAAGNIYVTVYAGWVKKITPAGAVTTIAGNGTEGYSGDGGPATAAQLFHPHALALGPDGALYVADTENRRIRRIDLATGLISTFGGDIGVTVSLAIAADGTVYSADVVRDGAGGGVTRTTPAGVTTRVVTSRDVNGVALASNGALYVNQWQTKRIQRLDSRTGKLETVARG
jgi:sugar lactone lactonase YvrE